MARADTDRRVTARRTSRLRPAALLAAALLALPHAPAAASDDGSAAMERVRSSSEPPGLDGRDTHLTRMTAGFSDCYEIAVFRAASLSALRAAVPARYGLFFPEGSPSPRLTVIDASCVTSVDDQRRERRSVVTLGLAALTSRDGVATPNSSYVLWLGTDDAVLAARLRQVGLPAEFLPGSSSTDQPVEGGSTIGFEFVGDGLDHDLTMTVVEPPPAILPPGTPFTAYYDGPRGDIRLRDVNALTAATEAKIFADLTGIEVLQPLLALPRLATLSGGTFRTFSRGGWTRTVERLD